MLGLIILSLIMQNVKILSVAIQSVAFFVAMLNGITLSVIILMVVAP
jgi:hypothetical protein